MISKFIDEKINKIINKKTGLKRSLSHPPFCSFPDDLISSPDSPCPPYSLPPSPSPNPNPDICQSPHPTLRPYHKLNNYLPECLKKSTITDHPQKNYITDILEEDMGLINDIIMTIITDYDRYTNKITNPDYFIIKANSILREYIDVNDFKTDNIYQAYIFIILGNMVSFWIFYKFLIDDSSLNVNYLLYYLELNNVASKAEDIFNIEIDILKSINYSVMRFI